MKILGPKKASSTSVRSVLLFSDNQRARPIFSPYASKPVPGFDNYDPDLAPQDRFLLGQVFDSWFKLLYDDDARVLVACVRLFGRSLNHPSLRPAVCVWIRALRGLIKSPFASEYCSQTQVSLMRRLRTPERLDVGDFLASFLLAAVGNFGDPTVTAGGTTTQFVHIEGCINLFNSLYTSSGCSFTTHFPPSVFIFIKQQLFFRLKCPLTTVPRIRSSFFHAFSSGPGVLLTLDCVQKPSSSAELPIFYYSKTASIEVFYRLRDLLSTRTNSPIHPVDPDSNDVLLVRQISAYLKTKCVTEYTTPLGSLVESNFPLFLSDWMTHHFQLAFGTHDLPFHFGPPAMVNFEVLFQRVLYVQFSRIFVTALEASSLWNGLCSSEFQENITVLWILLRDVVDKVEDLHEFLRSSFPQNGPEIFHGIHFYPITH
jgi:hypothetical protein